MDRERLDREVTERLSLLCRWTAAVRHDLGNLVYADAGLLNKLQESGGEPGKLAERVVLLTEMLDASRAGLDEFRWPPKAGLPAVTQFSSWWVRFATLARVLVGGSKIERVIEQEGLRCVMDVPMHWRA